MAVSPKLILVLLLGVFALLLAYGAFLTFTTPSTTLYFLIFPIGTIGPSFVQYLAAFVMLAVGIALMLVDLKLAV